MSELTWNHWSSLPELLADYRRNAGLSAREAGALVGGSHAVWSTWESGKIPSPMYLARLAELLGLTVSELRSIAGPDRVRRARSVGEDGSCAIAQWRLMAGVSASELARRLMVSLSLVSRWESGERVPAQQYWPALAVALGIPESDVEHHLGAQHAPSDVARVTALGDIRRSLGMTQSGLAALAGVDVTSIQRWESRGSAPFRRAVKLAGLLDTDLRQLAAPAGPAVHRMPKQMPLRRLRERRYLPTRVVAQRIGVSPSALLAWERGDAVPSWLHARKLAAALNVPVRDVFEICHLKPPVLLSAVSTEAKLSGAGLRELRRWSGSRQADLGAAVGVTASTVGAWEQGRQRPGPGAKRKLLELINS